MTKFLCAGLLVAGLMLAGVTIFSSQSAEHHFRALEVRLAGMPDVRVLDSSYRQGLSASTAETSFELRGDLGEAFRRVLEKAGREDVRGRVGFHTRHEIRHGLAPLWDWLRQGADGSPVLAQVVTRIDLDQEAHSELMAVLGRLPSVRVDTTLRSSGVGEGQLHADAVRLRARLEDPQEASGWSGDFRGMRGTIVFHSGTGALAGRLASPGLELVGPETTFSFAGLELHFDTQLDASGVRVGEVGPRLARLRVRPTAPPDALPSTAARTSSAPGLEPASEVEPEGGGTEPTPDAQVWLELTELRASQETRVSGGKLQTAYDLGLQRLAFDGETHGPGEVEVSIRDVDLAALAESGVGPVGLLRAGAPVVDLARLELATGHGLLRAKGHLRLSSGWSDDSAANPLLALLGTLAVLEIECPLGLLESVWPERAGQIAELEESGYLIREGEAARVLLELRAGTLTANGQPVDPGLFPASLADLAEAGDQGRRP